MGKSQSDRPSMLPNQTGGLHRHTAIGYFTRSSQPWHILLFLLPFVIAYELGSTGIIGSGVQKTLEAQDLLIRFFDLFGTLGLHLPAIALVVVLFLQHLLSKHHWTIEPITLLAMIAESSFLTGPLIIFVIILQPVVPQLAAVSSGSPVVFSADFQQSLFLAIGAGLYEEMLFRLVLITIIHFLVADVLGFKDRHSQVVAVLLSAIAFAWLHQGVYTPGAGFNVRVALFYFLAGVYFGVLFLARGLGIAVGTHLMYDILALVIMPGIQDSA